MIMRKSVYIVNDNRYLNDESVTEMPEGMS